MFERFTDRARRVVVLAQEEARRFGHNYIGTEHLLLGLLDEGESVAGRILTSFGLTREKAATSVEEAVGPGAGTPGGHIPFTPRSKKVMELALREALDLHHNYIGTEHLLLGILREGEGVGAHVLRSFGLDLSAVRQKVVDAVSAHGREEAVSLSVSASASIPAAFIQRPEADYPLCPICASPLAETLAWRHVTSSDRIDAGRFREAAVAYCSKCGRALGVVPS